ncbi:MAG: hypothetical protein ACD_21C00204G0008 [uncultured bacterium]|nr:MAG: hypothetical protein ACD_21C00204G0008 [uncultured bacterium]
MLKIVRLVTFLITIQLFSAGCSLNPNTKYNIEAANINAKLGIAYLQQNRTDIAKNKLLLALKQAPNDAKVHDSLGYFFAHTGEPTLAEKHYLYALKYANEKGIVWQSYGDFLYQQNRYKEALKYFLLATKDVNYLYVARAYACASDAALKLKQNNLSRRYHQEALLHDPYIVSTTPKILPRNPAINSAQPENQRVMANTDEFMTGF